MRNRLCTLLVLALLGISNHSCKKDQKENEPAQGLVELSFALDSEGSNGLKSAVDSAYIQGITSIVITIEDEKGNKIKDTEKIDIYNMNGYFLSKPLSLEVGNYKLTSFYALDARNKVLYASPMVGSPKAYLVQNPLPISFSIKKDVVTKLIPEVISTAELTPTDFGYATFHFEIADSFDILLGVFIYNDSTKKFQLTNAHLSIFSGAKLMDKELSPLTNNGLNAHDSLGITEKISLPEQYNNFTLKITKLGYNDYEKSFTKEELRLYYRKEDKGPLVIILSKIAPNLEDGLISYYPFNGDAEDHFGNNHGIDYSTKSYLEGIDGLAHDFNGSTDYIRLTNTISILDSFSFCFWIKSHGAISTENNGSVIAKYNMAYPQRYCININTFGAKAYNTQTTNWIGAAVFSTGDQNGITEEVRSDFNASLVKKPELYTFSSPRNLMLNQWEFAVINITSKEVQVYLNGVLCVKKKREVLKYYDSPIEPTYIGNNFAIGEGSNNHFNGLLDNLRLYSRPLTVYEILYMYQNKL